MRRAGLWAAAGLAAAVYLLGQAPPDGPPDGTTPLAPVVPAPAPPVRPRPRPMPPAPPPRRPAPPAPAPSPSGLRVMVFVQSKCAPCDRLKREWPADCRHPVEWKNVGADPATRLKWKVVATPTVLLVGPDGREVRRLEGYGSPDELRRFLADGPPDGG